MGSGWNMRVVCDTVGEYGFREVFYDANGQPDSYSSTVVTPRAWEPEFRGDEAPVDSLRGTVAWMLVALDQPILDECEGEKLVERKETKP